MIPLQVSGAFHSSLLQEAGKQLYQVLSGYELKTPRIPVLHNLSAAVADRPLITLLSEQISHSAVSYTHLDVYKRQDTGRAHHFRGNMRD